MPIAGSLIPFEYDMPVSTGRMVPYFINETHFIIVGSHSYGYVFIFGLDSGFKTSTPVETKYGGCIVVLDENRLLRLGGDG